MGTKPKTRVLATVDGIDKELLSIRERTDKSLVLMPLRSENVEDPYLGNLALSEWHLSVHKSDLGAAPATTITLKTEVANGDIHSAAALITSQDQLVWPAIAIRPPSLGERYNAKVRDKDATISVGRYDPTKNTLALCVVVASNEQLLPELPRIGVKLQVLNFGRYALGIYTGFLDLPTLPFGDYVGAATSAPRINNLPKYDLVGAGMPPMNPEQIDPTVGSLLHVLGEQLSRRIEAMQPPGVNMNYVRHKATTYNSTPLE